MYFILKIIGTYKPISMPIIKTGIKQSYFTTANFLVIVVAPS